MSAAGQLAHAQFGRLKIVPTTSLMSRLSPKGLYVVSWSAITSHWKSVMSNASALVVTSQIRVG